MSDKTLAERCFAHDADASHEELFEQVQVLLGGEPVHGNCLRDDFQWKVLDTWTDAYDQSIEVILAPSAEPMTREQADSILALGFGQIYESPTGVQWTKTYSGKVSPKEAHGDRTKDAKLRERLAALQKLAGEMAEAIRDSGFTGTYKKVDCLRKYRTLNPVPDSGK